MAGNQNLASYFRIVSFRNYGILDDQTFFVIV